MPIGEKNHGFIKNRYIDFMIGICYNASRQKDMIIFNARQKPPERQSLGAFFLCFYGTLTEACCCYHRLSNHLQMRWQVTPAATATKKDMIGFNEGTPFLLPDWGSNVVSIAWFRTIWNIKKLPGAN